MQRFQFLNSMRLTCVARATAHSLRLCVSAVAFALLFNPIHLAARPKTTVEKKPTLISLRLFPQKVTLWGAGGSQRFVALGKYSDGLERDVTAVCRLSLQEPTLAIWSSQ